MTTFQGGKTREGWGVLDGSGFRLQDSPYRSRDQIPFTICELNGAAIALVVEYPRSPQLHTQLAQMTRPPWIDVIGQTTLASRPNAPIALVDADLIAPLDFDRRVFAFAAAIVLFSHGLFECVPKEYEVRVGDQSYTISMTFDDHAESWSADVQQHQ